MPTVESWEQTVWENHSKMLYCFLAVLYLYSYSTLQTYVQKCVEETFIIIWAVLSHLVQVTGNHNSSLLGTWEQVCTGNALIVFDQAVCPCGHKISGSLAWIRNNVTSRTRAMIVPLYLEVVRPPILCLVLAPHYKKDIEALEHMQRRVTKQVRSRTWKHFFL